MSQKATITGFNLLTQSELQLVQTAVASFREYWRKASPALPNETGLTEILIKLDAMMEGAMIIERCEKQLGAVYERNEPIA